MRVFVTGASGWIGSAVVPELIGAGHQVIGLARSDASAAALTAAGAEVAPRHARRPRRPAQCGRGIRRRDPPRLQARHRLLRGLPRRGRRRPPRRRGIRRGARRLRPTARHRLGDARALTRTAGDRAGRPWSRRGGGRVGCAVRRPGGPRPSSPSRSPPAASAHRSCGCRRPNHGDGDNGFMATLVEIARDKGVSGYIGDGANRWPAVHRLDAARLFRLALEKAPAGSTLHAVADEGVPIRDVAEVIGRHLDVPVAADLARGCRRALHLAGRLPRPRQPGLERADPRAAGMAADAARADRGPRPGSLLRHGVPLTLRPLPVGSGAGVVAALARGTTEVDHDSRPGPAGTFRPPPAPRRGPGGRSRWSGSRGR